MADVAFNAAMGVAVQGDGYGTPDPTLKAIALSGLDSTDGLVMGDYDAGDGRSGIVIPGRVPLIREKAAAGRTRTQPSYKLTEIDGLSIVYSVMGNGANGTPAVGDAKPLIGLRALNGMAGLFGQNGAVGNEYDYAPATAAQIADLYGTIKLWVGNMAYVYQDCVVNSRATVFEGGKPAIRTDNILVGSLVTSEVDIGESWPTGGNAPDYTTQASQDAPVCEGLANIWGHTRGFQTLTITINNNFARAGDVNVVTTGERLIPGEIEILASGVLWRDDSDDDFEWEQSIYGEGATSFNFQVGTVEASTGIMNAFKTTMPTPRATKIRDSALEGLVADEIEITCRGASEASEFEEMYN